MTKQLRGTSEQVDTDTAEGAAAPDDLQNAQTPVESVGRRGAPMVKLASQLQAAAVVEGSRQSPCERCRELNQQVKELRELRDLTLEELARAREQVNALRLRGESYAAPAEPPPPAPPPPLRYVIADRLNVQLKRYLGSVHLSTKRALEFATKSGGRG